MCFSLYGIRFEISYLFLSFVLTFIAFDRTGIYIPLLLGVIIHETSHLVLVYIFKSKVKAVKLILGAITVEYLDICSKPKKIVALLAGPISNLIVALISYKFNNNLYCAVNLILGIYNLLPINGLDGGAMLSQLFDGLVPHVVIKKIIAYISFLVSIAAIFFVIYKRAQNLVSIVIICIYIITPLIFKKILKD